MTEYDAKKQRKMDIRDAREEGKAEAETSMLALIDAMTKDGKVEEIPRISKEPEFLKAMKDRYHIE